MDALTMAAGGMALVAAGAALWLLMERGKLRGEVGVLRAEVGAAESRRAAAEAAIAAGGAELAVVRQQLSKAEVLAGSAAASLEAERRARAEDAREAQEDLETALKNARALSDQQLESVRREARVTLEAAEKARAEIEAKLGAFDAKMRESFGNLAGEALRGQSAQFLALAEQKLAAKGASATADLDKQRVAVEQLVRPIAEALTKTQAKLGEIEQQRVASYADLKSKIEDMSRAGGELRSETARLVKALREPQVRGRYGETQLRRVVEVAGLRSYCDFVEQATGVGDDGRVQRPDLIVRLPGGRELIVDAKANLKPYVDAMEATSPEEAEQHLVRFAEGVAEQAGKLAKKGYYAQYSGTPDFVLMFVPGDQFVDAALTRRPDLIETAASNNVILVSPSSLIGALRAVAVCLREERLAQEAQALQELGRELHKRAAVAMEHVERLGRNLRQSVEAYNAFVGSYERNLEPTLRKFEESGLRGAKELPETPVVEVTPRLLSGGVDDASAKR